MSSLYDKDLKNYRYYMIYIFYITYFDVIGRHDNKNYNIFKYCNVN